ncbi:MAG: LysR family transcriptional regulator [Rubrivivax sp.]|nr:MAG: LysR family transcriptional regulator [Rubrivivax sp.]
MDKLKAMEAFVRVVDTGGFTRAAEVMQAPKATVSTLIQDLESQLGVRLLHRTTRKVTVTADGAAYYERCLRILDDLREADESVSSRQGDPNGRLRVDVFTGMASYLMVSGLPDFLARHPRIRLEMGCSDRPVNMVSEGVDCVIRAGEVNDSSLIARRIGSMWFVPSASPAYLARHGVPRHPNDLHQHTLINYFLPASGRVTPWDFSKDGERLEWTPDTCLALNDSKVYEDACLAGMGIGTVPSFAYQRYHQQGLLQAVLTDWVSDPVPLYVVYASKRHLSTKVQAFVEWVAEFFENAPGLRRPVN